jgi:cyclopropane fatty-acyl-phospholipid synthase-like methyltransferase
MTSPQSTAAPIAQATAEDVRLAYHIILGRAPESEEVISQQLQDHPTLWRLLQIFYASPEGRRRRITEACAVISDEQDGRGIEVEADPDALEELTRHVAQVWARYGREDAYYSVLTDPRYLSERRKGDDVEALYGTGVAEVASFHKLCARNGVSPDPAWTVLELGCGVGRMAEAFANQHARYIGVDISAEHLSLARDRLEARQVVNTELRLLPAFLKEPGAYDVFFSVLVLQHNPPPIIHDLLDHAFAHLRTGGYAAFQVPCHLRDYRFQVQGYLSGEGRLEHMEMHALPQRHVFALMRKHGLTPLEVTPNARIGPSGFSYGFLARKD